jgi:hypothetical protein
MSLIGRVITLEDGREQQFVPQLDFRAQTEAFDDAESSQLDILREGVVIGFVSPLKWLVGEQGTDSLRVAFQAENTGESIPMYLPKNKHHPQRNLRRIAAPVFDLSVTSLDRKSDLVPRNVGEIAIAYALPQRYPGLKRKDIPRIAEILDIRGPARQHSSFGHVEPGTIYYITPDGGEV